MRKRTVFGITLLLLVSLTSLMPVVKATTYVWDNVHFVKGYEGEWIKYPHPDRNYYGISPYNSWDIDGTNLHHHQWDSATSLTLVATAIVLCTALGAYIGARIGGVYGAVTGAVVGGALGVIITYVSEALFLDEYNCIWWWVSVAFINWCSANAFILWYYSSTNPSYALTLVLSALYSIGYIRVGAVTFLDSIGAGNPKPLTLSISVDGNLGGTTNPAPGTYTYSYGSSVTVNAIPSYFFNFRYWIRDGPTPIPIYSNPITITMDSDHTLTAYFEYSGGFGCPTLFVWSGTGYVDYGVINIHNPSGEDVVKEVPIQVEDVGINRYKATFRLREGWEGLNYSESVIDQVKLYAVDDDGNRYLCPLISAKHNSLGNVLPQLLLSDDIRVQTLLLQTIDLTFIVPYQNIESFTFVIEGCNIFKIP